MTPDAVQDIDEEGEDIDYDALYGGEDISDELMYKSPELQRSYLKIFGDLFKQGAKETLIGLGGTYGDLAELAGLKVPGKRRDVEVLEENADSDQPYSLQDIYALSADDELSGVQPPTSGDLRKFNEMIGGPGEPETPQGAYAARAGRLYGSGLPFGQLNPVPAVAAGVAGQAVEDIGGGPLAQTAAEIATLLLTSGKSSLVGSAKKDVKNKINALRDLGYPEEDITLAINNASKGRVAGIKATKGAATEEAFENFAKHSDEIVSDILSAQIPGIEKGIENVHKAASDAYGQVAKQASNIIIKDAKPFTDSVNSVTKQLKNTLGKNPEAQQFLKRLSQAAKDAQKNPTAEKFMNFYKELNSMGNWMGRSYKDKLISQLKNGIKDTFKAEGKAGKELAKNFEDVNAGIQKAYRAEEVHNLIQKASSAEGIDYKKLYKSLSNEENFSLLQNTLGNRQAKNLKFISKTGKEIGDFDKAWKSTNLLKGGAVADTARSLGAAYYLYKGDWEGLALVLATKGGSMAAKKLAEKSLTSPRFQNIIIRGLNAIKSSSPKALRSANEAMQKFLDDEEIGIDLEGEEI